MEPTIREEWSAAEKRLVIKTFEQLHITEQYPFSKKHYERIHKLASTPVLVTALRGAIEQLNDVTVHLPAQNAYFYGVGVLLADGGNESMATVRARLTNDLAFCTPPESLAGKQLVAPIEPEAVLPPWLHVFATYRQLIMEFAPAATGLLLEARNAWKSLAKITRAYRLLELTGVEPPSDTDWTVTVMPRLPGADACIEAHYTGFFQIRAVGSFPADHFPHPSPDALERLRDDLDVWAARHDLVWDWETVFKHGADARGTLVQISGLSAADRKKVNAWWRRSS